MKVRSGFVSNSSSTSFVIVIDTEKQPQLLKLLERWSERSCHYDTEVVSSEKDEIISKALEGYYNEDLTDKLEKVTDGGKYVPVWLELEYHDDVIRHYIHQDGVEFVHNFDC